VLFMCLFIFVGFIKKNEKHEERKPPHLKNII
jgi:hypothetical protein